MHLSEEKNATSDKMNVPKMNIDQFLFICGISYTEEQIIKLQNLVDNFIQKILEIKPSIKSEPQNYNDFLEAERRKADDADLEDDENGETPNYSAFLNVETELDDGGEKNDDEISDNYTHFMNVEKNEYSTSEKHDWKISF